MDIFNSALRSKEEAVKSPLNYPEASVTERKLQEDHLRETELFQTYLRNLYAKFDFRINKCRYNCYSTAHSYAAARHCEHQCAVGVGKFAQYVESRVGEMQELLGNCVANAAQLPNTVDEIYHCYERYNLSFSKLKQFITEESMYYE